MIKYDAQKFLNVLREKIKENVVCPFCGGNSYNVPGFQATIITGKEAGNIGLDTSVPAGLIICAHCGHMEFFALGALGLLKEEGDNNDEHKD